MSNNDKTIKVELESYILYDRLNLLAVEYATSTDKLVNIAVQRLLDDVALVQGLRKGTFPAYHQRE